MPYGREEFVAGRQREMRAYQADRRQRRVTAPECSEHIGESPDETRRLNPPVGGMLGQLQHVRAVGEKRRAAFTEVQPPRIHFGEKLDETRCRGALGSDRAAQFDQQIIVRQIGEERARSRHDPLYHCDFRLSRMDDVARSAGDAASMSPDALNCTPAQSSSVLRAIVRASRMTRVRAPGSCQEQNAREPIFFAGSRGRIRRVRAHASPFKRTARNSFACGGCKGLGR
jgi:hypothetical protein